jgi:hypothetical protein
VEQGGGDLCKMQRSCNVNEFKEKLVKISITETTGIGIVHTYYIAEKRIKGTQKHDIFAFVLRGKSAPTRTLIRGLKDFDFFSFLQDMRISTAASFTALR